jgi:hypothetical protein
MKSEAYWEGHQAGCDEVMGFTDDHKQNYQD